MTAADESPADRPVRKIDCRTIGGAVYLRSRDVQAALKIRAAEYDELAEEARLSTGDAVEREMLLMVYAAAAAELRHIAERHQFAEIEHQETHPGDSVIHTPCTNCQAEVEYCTVCGAKL